MKWGVGCIPFCVVFALKTCGFELHHFRCFGVNDVWMKFCNGGAFDLMTCSKEQKLL